MLGLSPWDGPAEIVAHFDWVVHLLRKPLTVNTLLLTSQE
jgi:hypothetical protein